MGTYKNNIYHLCKRLEEHFGIKTKNKAARKSVAKEIAGLVKKAKQAAPKKKFYKDTQNVDVSNTRSIHTITFRGIKMRVVYCKSKNIPITAYPIEN